MSTLIELLSLVKELPEEYLNEALERIKEIKERADSAENTSDTTCVRCGSALVVRNGHKHRKQAYLCRNCGKSFVSTTKSAIQNSECSETVWKQVVRDTVEGVSIDKTAENLGLHHETVFNMRHKILYAIEQTLIAEPVGMTGVCEADETYVLESQKGTKIPDDYHRGARKHGAKASKRGISDEYICVCASVTGMGENLAVAVNRASPSGEEILEVFGEKVNKDTVLLCDGKQSYGVLGDKCTVATTNRVNKVNGLHSFIKERLDDARGVATKYLNRYNALFSKIYANDGTVADEIFNLMTMRTGLFGSIKQTQSVGLLDL